jgi:hypothetical protein
MPAAANRAFGQLNPAAMRGLSSRSREEEIIATTMPTQRGRMKMPRPGSGQILILHRKLGERRDCG